MLRAALAEPEDWEERQGDQQRLPVLMDSAVTAATAVRLERQETAATAALAVIFFRMAELAATAAIPAVWLDWAEPAELEPEARPVARRELMDSP